MSGRIITVWKLKQRILNAHLPSVSLSDFQAWFLVYWASTSSGIRLQVQIRKFYLQTGKNKQTKLHNMTEKAFFDGKIAKEYVMPQAKINTELECRAHAP